MRVGVAGVWVAVLVGVSGCAGSRTRQELTRLQSQVGILDERLSQLERAGALPPAPVELSGADSGLTLSSPAPVKAAASSGSSTRPPTLQVQQALKNAGFYQGAVDGKMGAMTRSAIQEFQRVHGLNDDGIVGKLTWAKLRPYVELSAGGGEQTAPSESFK